MKKSISEILEERKRQIYFHTDRSNAPFGREQFGHTPVAFDLSEKTQAVACGGVALFKQIAQRTGLVDALNSVPVLKRHLPYWESDHLLNIAFNVLAGGTALEHIEYRRNDPVYLKMLDTHAISDPTTVGDFCRRYAEGQIIALMDAVNETRLNVWSLQKKSFFDVAYVHVDGSIAPTTGRYKQGMDISYKGIWGYHPLIVSLANTKEILFVMNRSGNRPSYEGAFYYIDKSIVLLRRAGFKEIRLCGDTDFSQTEHLDRWDEPDVTFVFGIDARKNLVHIAESLGNADWKCLERQPSYEMKTKARRRRENVKERIVREREFKNLTTTEEHVAEFDYRPHQCGKAYRMIVLRKTIKVTKGQLRLFDEIRYFFYITNDWSASPEEIVFESNDRCDQENLIGQMKSGLGALRMPLDNLVSNWVHMYAMTLAWSLKAWSALILPVDGRKPSEVSAREKILRMEFATFLQAMVMIPAQILRSGRRLIVRFLNMNSWTETFFRLAERLRRPLLE